MFLQYSAPFMFTNYNYIFSFYFHVSYISVPLTLPHFVFSIISPEVYNILIMHVTYIPMNKPAN